MTGQPGASNESTTFSGVDLCSEVAEASDEGFRYERDPHKGTTTLEHGSDAEEDDKELLEPIAVIGLSCKFPEDATSPELFWKMIMDKKCASRDYPPERMNIDAFYHPDISQRSTISTKGAHFIREDIRAFDAPFFSIPPQEAGNMDPQHRGLLEATYHALENAGVPLERIAGTNTSVHVGCFTADYIMSNWRDSQQIPKYSATGTAASILANRISWFYDLQGPSMTVDTACSSGMVAMDLACRGIWSRTSDIVSSPKCSPLLSIDREKAIVAGANIISSVELNIALSNMNFLSPDARCYSFDHRASGYARGEGFGVLVLKPLNRAVRDGDTIRALIRSTGINQDGHTTGGITQPSKDLQASLIKDTYKRAGLNMKTTRFFEAHGTGTFIGDPIEAAAMGQCFRSLRSPEDPLYIGAVKSNVGHLEGSSGIAGLIKAILAVEKGVIPPNTNFEKLNSQIDADFLHLKFPTESVPWPDDGVRRASVNSFGFGGTNGHVIVDDAYHYLVSRNLYGISAPTLKTRGLDVDNSDNSSQCTCKNAVTEAENLKDSPPMLLVWSAADETGLYRLCSAYSQWFPDNTSISQPRFVNHLAHTLNQRRSSLSWKSYAILDSIDVLANLKMAISEPVKSTSAKPYLGFAFTGQGAQWHGMARELLEYPVFRASLLRSQDFLQTLQCSWILLVELTRDQTTTRINDPELSQPLCTAVQIALVDLYCAGYLSHASAIRVAYYRGALASKLAKAMTSSFSMLSVGLSESSVEAYIRDLQTKETRVLETEGITISCVNSPNNVTVSGPNHLLEQFQKHLQDRNVFLRQLKVNLGYHSSQMSAIAEEYLSYLQGLSMSRRPSQARMISTITSNTADAKTVCSGRYWVQNLVSPVKFCQAMTTACFRSSKVDVMKKLDRSHIDEIVTDIWVELGPHSTLRGPIGEILQSVGRSKEVTYMSALVREHAATHTFLRSVGRLYCQGIHVNLANWTWSTAPTAQRPVVLPNLPQYPFNHSTIYWEESQSNANFLFRRHPRLDLLGAPTIDWNPMDAKWKFIIRSDELPWIMDHKINGSTLYPAAGMLVATLEATRLVANDPLPIGYEIRDAEFNTPLLLTTSTSGTEVQVGLTSRTRSSMRNNSGFDFRILCQKPDQMWEEACRGYIRPDYGRVPSDVDGGKETQELSSHLKKLLIDSLASCQFGVDAVKMYEQLREEVRIDYGPSFQVLDRIRYNYEDEAVAMVKPLERSNAHSRNPGIIHPTSLDGAFQLLFVALSKGGTSTLQTMVPTRIGRLWISSLDCSQSPGLQIHARARQTNKQVAHCWISGFDAFSQELKLRVEDCELTAVAGHVDPSRESREAKKICYHMLWKPDLDTLDNQSTQKFCEARLTNEAEPRQWFNDLELLILCFGAHILTSFDASGMKVPTSRRRYVTWLQGHLQRHIATVLLENRQQHESLLHDEANLDSLCERVTINKRGTLHVRVGKELRKVLSGDVDPLEFLFQNQDDLAEFYMEMISSSQAFNALATFMEALVHKNPNLDFVEIGAGTGAATRAMLQYLAASPDTLLFRQYVFTDISSAFIDKAREHFSVHERFDFRILDIEEEPSTQGFSEHQYDVLVASLVFHATKDLSITIQNARKLLRPGGKLILMELTMPHDIRTGFIFGLLPGWWLASESFRQESPCVSVEKWNEILLQNGFSGNDLVFRDYESRECQLWSLIVSTAVEQSTYVAPRLPKMNLILDRSSNDQQELAQELVRGSHLLATSVRMLSLDEAVLLPQLETEYHVFLTDYASSSLSSMRPAAFNVLQRLLTGSALILWVTQGGGKAPSNPQHGMLQGLCRVCSNENPKITLVTATLDVPAGLVKRGKHADLILTALQRTILGIPQRSFEPEYMELDGMLHINRLVEARLPNQHIFTRTKQPVCMQDLKGSPPLKLRINAPGLLDTLDFMEDTSFEEPLLPDDIEVEIRAIGVNFKECLIALRRIKSDKLGSECSGIISRVGTHCVQFQKGDRVALCELDCYKTRIRVKDVQAVKIPESMSFAEAASIPTAFTTAFYSLDEVARLQKDESILIHAGAGGTGQAAIQVAARIGAEIFTTVGSSDKKKLLMDLYGLPDDHIFYSRDTSFADGIKRMTGGRGVDVVLNSLSGDGLIASWKCVAPFGRFLEIGRKDIDARGQLPMAPFSDNVSFIGIDLAGIATHRTQVGRRLLQSAVDLVQDKKLQVPYPLHKYPLNDIEGAFRFLQSGKSSGKVVLDVEQQVILPVFSPIYIVMLVRNDTD
ncbi:MAG: hypothetical protein Q9181_003765 [Wetmoreana brouardii]